ncbi:MAG: hypothetical protein COV47_01400 [Candidatus Diapherotrites archaeon CG11_big_fil_rev_8_21_14_0_20_37_9]|nr:MAG: hypothetical protein COV47_01400 [Candidatus Diapherotrites archaeon CG11_big_fil_rev_8_21_14_0_20_37_9]
MFKKKAQVSIEYLTITAFLLIVSGLVFGFALFSFNENASIAKADDSVTTIVNNANLVASQGNGSKIFFEIDVPPNVTSFEINGKSVTMAVNTSLGSGDMFSYAKPNLTPINLSTHQGVKTLSATFTDGNVVVAEIA